jgi:hypothetical protein
MSVEQNTNVNVNVNVNQMRCNECNKKINITNSLTCKCDKLLCYKHRYHTEHKCTFDYKIHDRNILKNYNEKIEIKKIIKI